MDQLRVQVARARRRLTLEQFLGRAVWCLLAALSLAVVAIAVPRFIFIENLSANWDTLWLVGALGVGFFGAAIWTLIAPRTALDAAIEIDRRFELRERVASSLSLSTEDQTSDAGRALVSDAARAVGRIEVDEKFRVRLDRRALWSLVPAVLMFVLIAFFDNRSAESSDDPNSPTAQKQTKTSIESLRAKIAEQRKKAKEGDLPTTTEALFKEMEEGTRELTEKKDLDRTKATVKLNDLAKQLEERRQQLGGKEELQKQLENMKNLGAGPAEKAAQAMKEGNWQQAKDEVEKLQKQLAEGKLDDEAKKQLANQLQQIKEKLEAAAEARKQAMEDIKKQIEQQKQQGNMAKAGELQQKLDKMQQAQQQLDRMQQLAQQMAEAQQAMQQGDNQKAAAAMAKMAEQLQQMQQEQKEMEALDAMMNQLEMAKDMMACQGCNGAGCQACDGNQMAMGMGQGKNMDGKPGMGMGEGRGIGPRPDEKNDTNLRDTRVRQNVGRGGAVFGGMVEGPNIKGNVAEAIKEEMATLSAQPADPLTSERLPSGRREHAEEYFQILREGK
jgi:tetratricopeptide (TPR) repeat protein